MIIVYAALAGIVIALFSSAINTTPGVLGATWYGWPQAWKYVIVYPGSPTTYDFVALGADILFWFVIALIVLAFYKTAVQRSKPKTQKK